MILQNEEKTTLITQICREILSDNDIYSKSNFKFDYDTVINNLTKVKEVMEESLRSQRPLGLPENMIWSEKPYRIDMDMDPMVFDGSMSLENFERWQDLVLDEEPELD